MEALQRTCFKTFLLFLTIFTSVTFHATCALGSDEGQPSSGTKDLKGLRENLIVFDSSASFGKVTCLNWADSELNILGTLLERVKTQQPGLMKLATAGTPLTFHRVSKAQAEKIAETSGTVAVTHNNHVFIGDLFFEGKNQYVDIVHELTHCADTGCRIAYSESFIKSVSPTVRLLRKIDQSINSQERGTANQLLKFYRICSNIKMSANLKETLAYEFSAFCDYSGYPMSQSSAIKLINPGVDDIAWQTRFRRGMTARESGDWSSAIKEFTDAGSLDATPPLLHVELARCHFHGLNYASSVRECKRAISLFDELGVDLTEPNRRLAETILANNLLYTRKFSAAIDSFEKILRYEDSHAWAEIYQDQVNYCRNQISIQSKKAQLKSKCIQSSTPNTVQHSKQKNPQIR